MKCAESVLRASLSHASRHCSGAHLWDMDHQIKDISFYFFSSNFLDGQHIYELMNGANKIISSTFTVYSAGFMKRCWKSDTLTHKAQMHTFQTHALATGSRFLLFAYRPTNIQNCTLVPRHCGIVYSDTRDVCVNCCCNKRTTKTPPTYSWALF